MQLKATAVAGRVSSALLPDARFLRKEIPIPDVLKVLNIPHDSRRAVCPQCGKRTLSVHGKSNTVRCFRCDPRSLSTIDITSRVLGMKIGAAIRFLAANFEVPSVRVRLSANKFGSTKHKYRSYSKSKGPMTAESFILSPAWPKMPAAAKLILAALLVRVPRAGSEQSCIHAGYGRIEEWTGLRYVTVWRGLDWLRSNGWIHSETVPMRFRTKQGFVVRELFIRVNSHKHRVSATSNAVPKRNCSNAVSKTNSSQQELENWTPTEGATLQ